MVRNKTRNRLRDFVATAAQIFSQKGYRRTQMADVTSALGLSPGAIYRYLESKEALFDLAVRHALDPDYPLGDGSLPVQTPEPGATLAFLESVMAQRAEMRLLSEAVRSAEPTEIRAEFEGIIRELYSKLSQNRGGLNLIERCALDWPELAVLWFEQVRSRVIEDLERYLKARIEGNWFRPVPDTLAAARLIVEVAFAFAVHRHDDPFPTLMDEHTAEDTVVDNLLHAYLLSERPVKGDPSVE